MGYLKRVETAFTIPADAKTIILKVKDDEGAVQSILEHLKYCGDVGHSFSFKDDDKSFGFDGDGSDRVYSIEVQ